VSPLIAWRLGLIAAILAGVWYVVHLIKDNATLKDRLAAQEAAVLVLSTRAAMLEAVTLANNTFDDDVRGEATAGVSRNESNRRTDREVIAIDKPWPAAMRARVFNNSDPTSGSTEAAVAPATGKGRK
jgi:hypothetical protein